MAQAVRTLSLAGGGKGAQSAAALQPYYSSFISTDGSGNAQAINLPFSERELQEIPEHARPIQADIDSGIFGSFQGGSQYLGGFLRQPTKGEPGFQPEPGVTPPDVVSQPISPDQGITELPTL